MHFYDAVKEWREDELSKKNIYANHLNWFLCWWTGLGLYCAVHQDHFETTDKLFLTPSTMEGTAGKKYNEQLRGLTTRTQETIDQVNQHCRPNHFNAYGFRKGSASFATAGTTLGASLPSVAHRGEWSMGSVFDIYWKFLPIGDQYLGQILSGKDPNHPSFNTLPPHWKIVNPMSNEYIKAGMDLAFGRILRKHAGTDSDPTGVLTRCLACVMWHSDHIIQEMVTIPGHEFMKIPLLHETDLVLQLKALVTTDPTPGVMTVPTGIPPHIELASQLKEVLETVTELVRDIRENEESRINKILEAVQSKIEELNYNTGNVSGLRLKEMLEEHRRKMTNKVVQLENRLVQALRNHGAGANSQQQQISNNNNIMQNNRYTAGVNCFSYNGRLNFWHVPENFQFPRQPTLQQAIRFWLKGHNVTVTGDRVIRPYRKILPTRLPPNLQPTFRNQWIQFFKFVEPAWNIAGNANTAAFTEEELSICCQQMWTYLKENVAYCFATTGAKRRKDPQVMKLGTWAKKVANGFILKNGTAEDKAKLNEKGITQQVQRKAHTRPKRKTATNPLYPHRQRRHLVPNTASGTRLLNQDHDEAVGGLRPPRIVTTRGAQETAQDPEHNKYLQWLRDTFPKPAVPANLPAAERRRGRCAIQGCTNHNLQLEGAGTHYCKRCKIVVHNLCANDRNWYFPEDENIMFCSDTCKAAWLSNKICADV